ncbi:MAG: hypothetical protein K8S00_07210 [Bacteroidales bacterium]|nr:hypothetical protein [Bacteroidales bacterium]
MPKTLVLKGIKSKRAFFLEFTNGEFQVSITKGPHGKGPFNTHFFVFWVITTIDSFPENFGDMFKTKHTSCVM